MSSTRILILGVTGSGKGRLAFGLARHINAEIVSVDSMKVYRRMDIGTAKPPKDARKKVNYHLIDIVEPSDSFSVARFVDAASEAIHKVENRGKQVIAVGGTALYTKALLHGLFEGPGADEQVRNELKLRAQTEGLDVLYDRLKTIDPPAAESIHPNDARRIIRALEVHRLTGKPISALQQQWKPRFIPTSRDSSGTGWTIIGLRRAKMEEHSRINRRVKDMLTAGLVEEVKSLLAEEKPLSRQARCAIGYAEIIDFLNGLTSLEDVVELIKRNTRRLAKSQRTWFKTFRDVHWLDLEREEHTDAILGRVRKLIPNVPYLRQ
jgi:tRNA dimethylallyltransferase